MRAAPVLLATQACTLGSDVTAKAVTPAPRPAPASSRTMAQMPRKARLDMERSCSRMLKLATACEHDSVPVAQVCNDVQPRICESKATHGALAIPYTASARANSAHVA